MNSFSENSQSEGNVSENNISEDLKSKDNPNTLKTSSLENSSKNEPSTDSDYKKKETTEKSGGFSTKALNEIAFKALTLYTENFLRENKDLDSQDKSLGNSYNQAAELISNSHSVSENINNLEGLQDDALQVIIGARDSGNSVLKEVKDLSDFVLRITGSVKNINDIAERVHVLSLNAAIEAARAGEHGKGFAVVSSEIRSLAGSTAQRVEEISEYIRQSSATVDRLVTGTNTTVNSVSSTYDKLNVATSCRQDIAKLTLKIENDILEFRNVYLVESLRRQHSVLRVCVLQHLIKGDLHLDKDDIPNSRHCPLGRWYRENRNTIRALSDVSIYRRLDEAHELFHSIITQLQKASQYENQDQVMQFLDELEASNRQISGILLEVISVIKGTSNIA